MSKQIIDLIIHINPYAEITEQTSLIEGGILDSLTVVFLISQLETAFDIEIPEDRLQPENFETVEKIEQLIKEIIK